MPFVVRCLAHPVRLFLMTAFIPKFWLASTVSNTEALILQDPPTSPTGHVTSIDGWQAVSFHEDILTVDKSQRHATTLELPPALLDFIML